MQLSHNPAILIKYNRDQKSLKKNKSIRPTSGGTEVYNEFSKNRQEREKHSGLGKQSAKRK